MFLKLQSFFLSNRDKVVMLFERYRAINKNLMIKSDLWDEFLRFIDEENLPELSDTPLGTALFKAQEAVMDQNSFCLAVRPKVAHWHYLRYTFATRELQEIGAADFLAFKERMV